MSLDLPEGAVAVDLGGSSVRAAGSGSPFAEPARAAVGASMDRDQLVAAIASTIATAAGSAPVRIVVVAIPSFVMDDGTFGPSPALPSLTGARLGVLLAERTGADAVSLVPDSAAATLGEAHHGAGRGSSRFLCAVLGTGANAGAVVDGQLVTTAFGCLGDAGHVVVEPDGPPCGCGGAGCLEAICSGAALAAAGAAFGLGSARDVIDAARAGHQDGGRLVARAGTALGRAIATWSVLLWPDTVAVAGGLSTAGELLLGPARAELARVAPPYVSQAISVVAAQLGESATLAGAVALAGHPQGGM